LIVECLPCFSTPSGSDEEEIAPARALGVLSTDHNALATIHENSLSPCAWGDSMIIPRSTAGCLDAVLVRCPTSSHCCVVIIWEVPRTTRNTIGDLVPLVTSSRSAGLLGHNPGPRLPPPRGGRSKRMRTEAHNERPVFLWISIPAISPKGT